MDTKELGSDPVMFASLIAHQLQSPLSSVAQALQAVLGEYSGPLLPGQRGSLEKANERCVQAMTAVRRMLAILEARQGDRPVARQAPLTTVLRQVHGRYADEATRRKIEFLIDVAAEHARVGLAEPALTEIFNALVENALKYTPDGGRIRLAILPSGREGCVRVSVADSGIGIPESERDQVFQPFFRASTARASQKSGIGLGLAFVREVVTAAGGGVGVGRGPDGGAEFWLDLPSVARVEAAGTEAECADAFRVLIVGGVSAGSKAASKLVRLRPDAEVTVVDRGSVMAYAGCGLPYYVSGVVRDYRQLISSPAGTMRDAVFFHHVKNVRMRNHTEAVEIDRAGKRVRLRDLFGGAETWLPYDKLVLCTGAVAAVPAHLDTKLRNVFTLHGVRDAEGIKAAMAEGKARDVVIVGGGLLGIEITECLVSRGARVTIVEKRPNVLSVLDPDMAVLVEKHLASHGVKVVTGATVHSLDGEGSVRSVTTDQGRFAADMAILASGIRPNVDLARQAGLTLGGTGAILVDRGMLTSDPDIYAAGDCVEATNLVTGRPCYMPLGTTANKQARVAAVNLCGGADVFPGILETCICKTFDYTTGRTGLGEAAARAAGFEPVCVLVPGPDREHYMPNVGMLLLKLVVDAKTRRLLGLQATGPGAADKRIDVAAMAIWGGMTVDELANADLGYAPPYSPAMDNIITAANVARNKLDGLFTGVTPAQVHEMMKARRDFVFLDVRAPEEFARAHLPQSTPIPLGVLRSRQGELPKDRAIVTFCDISLRGYEASLILRAAGFKDVAVMEGGMAMWPYDVVT